MGPIRYFVGQWEGTGDGKPGVSKTISTEEFWNFRSEISEVLREKLRNVSSNEKERIANEVQYAVREFFPGGYMISRANVYR